MIIACDHIFNEDAGGFTSRKITVSGGRFGCGGGGEKEDYRDYYA